MKRLVFIGVIAGLMTMLSVAARGQTVVIDGFPVGKAGSVNQAFLKPYFADLSAVADTLRQYPLARAIVTGGADGKSYRNNNDALNPALALGRAHVLRQLLIDRFAVDSMQIVIVTESDSLQGPPYRYVSVRVVRDLADFESRLKAVEQRPPVKERFIPDIDTVAVPSDDFALQLGAGLSTSPFGGMPVVTGGVAWKHAVVVEAIFGYSLWDGDYRFQDNDLDTRRRMAGGFIIVYPFADLPVGAVGGWLRVEDIAQDYYKYVRLSEGPMIGLRANPLDFLSVTGTYNPAKHRASELSLSRADNDQFVLTVTAFVEFGGNR